LLLKQEPITTTGRSFFLSLISWTNSHFKMMSSISVIFHLCAILSWRRDRIVMSWYTGQQTQAKLSRCWESSTKQKWTGKRLSNPQKNFFRKSIDQDPASWKK
jgi:hypothetical protein